MASENEKDACCHPHKWLDRYGDRLYRHALFRTGNPAQAEDLVQETLLAAWHGRAKFSGKAQESTWLYAILEHKIQDYFRQYSRSPQNSRLDVNDLDPDIENAVFQRDGAWSVRPGSWGRNPQEDMESKDMLRILRECLRALPELQRSAFLLREWYGEGAAQCASALSITANHLSVLLHRARLQINRCLGAKFVEGENE
ncbi:RNA polymerase subunit sigma-70 [Acidithiobacillus marinus]|uniref:RNA polymerase sigma factor n=1 Tax=Acidithiobacillus marinus TaxID=187490 RepID=A0A2I1DNR6_9PROT|nr:sigma-70 family RNA polymerase sigma factor [Acidithiobacillus marinus]PKY11506.1 RNA polymerase subunit sigma-70 [Acidithiobacillus marinus]